MKLCLFACPRTGSSVIFRLIARYLRAKYGCQLGLTEVFNCDSTHQIDDTGTEIKVVQGEDSADYEREILRRVELLKKYSHHSYPFKVMSSQINEGIFQFIQNDYQVVCLERQNRFETVLSWVLARQSGFWSLEKDEVRPSIEKIQAQRNEYEYIRDSLLAYEEWKVRFPKILATLYYEDFLSTPDEVQYLEKLGWNDAPTVLASSYKKQVLKMFETGEKENFIANIDELEDWFTSDFGQRISAPL